MKNSNVLNVAVSWDTTILSRDALLKAQAQAVQLATDLKLPVRADPQKMANMAYIADVAGENAYSYPYELRVTEVGLELVAKTDQGTSKLFVDFVRGPLGYRRQRGGGLKQDLAKAVGIKTRHDNLKILDATAGLGRDAFVLASLGCQVILAERSSIMAALLADGLKRAADSSELHETLARMVLWRGDAQTFLDSLSPQDCPSVIYLDPMFPTQPKKSLTKIDLRLIRDIVGEDLDAAALLRRALEKARKRVVVKRPRGAPAILLLPAPSFVVAGKKNRFDVYLTGGHYLNS